MSMLFNPFIFRDLWPLHPPVGVWIGVLGLLGVLVTLLRDVTKIDKVEKAVWTSVMFSLLLLEMKSVYQDRSEHDIEQAEARAEELRQFGNIANGISTTIAQNQEHFDATMKRSEEISQGVRAEMSSTKRVIGLSNKTLNTVTGGDSFCFVHMGWNADGFDGVIFQRGAHNVFDVNVRLIDGTALRAAEVNWVNSPAARHWRPGDKDPVNPEDYEFEASFPVVQTARSGKDDSSIHLIRLGHFKVPPSDLPPAFVHVRIRQ